MSDATQTLNVSAESQALFNAVWSGLTQQIPEAQLQFPREILWLNGAPGAGKGTHTDYLLELTQYSSQPIVISGLLQSPEAQRIKDAGLLVGDEEVMRLLFLELTREPYRQGVIVDGFPRTQIQADCLRLFQAKLKELEQDTALNILVLFIDEELSIERQLHRGRIATSQPNSGEEIRKTDQNAESAQYRYKAFIEQSYTALSGIKDYFGYHKVNASGSLEDVRKRLQTALHR